VNLSRISQCIWNGLIYKKTKKKHLIVFLYEKNMYKSLAFSVFHFWYIINDN